jgi:alanyl-tRNA synthetase
MTDRLYYRDSYLREFSARVVDIHGDLAYLDRSAFYPSSGGQPSDTGMIDDSPVVEVIDEGDRVAHRVAKPVRAGVVECRVDWERRFDHMQQHSGQHLLSAVLQHLFEIPTVSVHLGQQTSTIDIGAASLDASRIERLEVETNRRAAENIPVRVSFEDASAAAGLRKPSERQGELRIVSIEGLDRSACGGTHVRATGEIGPVLIRKLDKIRGNVRIEFVCGLRAIRRARADFEALSRIGRALSTTIDDAPELVSQQAQRLADSEKMLQRLTVELAASKGKQAYAETEPSTDGVRRQVRRLETSGIDEEAKAYAQGFTSGARSAIVVAALSSRGILLAASADSGIHAAERLKPLLAQAGGKGGGNAAIAQGSVGSPEALEALIQQVLECP